MYNVPEIQTDFNGWYKNSIKLHLKRHPRLHLTFPLYHMQVVLIRCFKKCERQLTKVVSSKKFKLVSNSFLILLVGYLNVRRD